jgi:hypothetical protein
LPGDLGSLDLSGDTKKLADDKLVTYKPETRTTPTPATNTYSSTILNLGQQTTPVYYYQLCVSYKRASSSTYRSYDSFDADSTGYSTYLSAYQHPAGEVCYKLKTADTYNAY